MNSSELLAGHRGRSLSKDVDLTKGETLTVLDLATSLREQKRSGHEVERRRGRNTALILEPSARTRPTFAAGANVSGAQVPCLRDGVAALKMTDEVFASSASVVIDEAVSRLHTIEAIPVATSGELS